MGNGVGRRYKKTVPEEEEAGHHAWRAPKSAKKAQGSSKPAAQPEAAVEDPTQWVPRLAAPAALPPAALGTGGKGVAAGRARGGGKGGPSSSPSAMDDDDDEDFAEFANLANAAAKVWDDLMGAQKMNGPTSTDNAQEFKALFYVGELKDSVERAVKRAEALQREATSATANVTRKQDALEKLCKGFEERAGPQMISKWKLGDFALRRGKGLSEISMVHYEADPPYFEVRMVVTGSVVGTEATNLITMSPPQQAQARAAMRELEQAKQLHSRAEEAVAQAAKDLMAQHETLTAEVEKKMLGGGAAEGALSTDPQPPAGMALPPGVGPGGRVAPPGLPDLNLISKWSGPSKGASLEPAPAAAAAAPEKEEYPDMRGLKEDFRGSGGLQTAAEVATAAAAAAAAPQPAQPAGPVDTSSLPTAGAAPQPQACAPLSAPMGFPSMDHLNKSEQEAAEREKTRLAAAQNRQNYPGVNPNAAKEVFHRPGEENTNRQSSKETQEPSPAQPAPAASAAAPGPAVPPGFAAGNFFDKGVPAGFPRIDPNAQQPPPQRSNHLGAQAQQAQAQAQAAAEQARKLQEAERQRQAEAQARAEADARANADAQARADAQTREAAATAARVRAAAAQPQTDWVMYRTENGELYYHNERTNETAWTLPVGHVARDTTGAGNASAGQQGTQAWFAQQQAQAQAQAQAAAQAQAQAQAQAAAQTANDPWAGLRQQEQDMHRQQQAEQQQWQQWYQQYSAWYQQTQSGVPPGAHYQGAGAQQQQQHPQFGSAGGAQQQAYVPPKGPQPPKLDANLEDKAIYAMKNAVLKEMESMLEQGEPVARRKKALRCLQIQWHPDKNPDKEEAAKSVFQFIEETKSWFLHDPDSEAAAAPQ